MLSAPAIRMVAWYRFPLLIPAFLALPQAAGGQVAPGHHLRIGPGTLLIIPDQSTGLTLWAARETRPGRRPSPDFVGWFDPADLEIWLARSRPLLTRQSPPEGEGVEGPPLTALDGGRVSLVLVGPPEQSAASLLIAFGHPRERQRWVIEASAREIRGLLDSLERLAAASRLAPPPGLGYANPTHRATTPDREPASRPPDVRGFGPGEIWAVADLDTAGAVIAGTSQVVWCSPAELAAPVLAVLPQYRYHRRDGGRPERLRIYQRFRVKAAVKGEP